jgi:hypothetical protein
MERSKGLGRLPFLRGQILVSVMHCSPTIHPDIPLRRIGILFHLASLLTFGHISALIGPYAHALTSFDMRVR